MSQSKNHNKKNPRFSIKKTQEYPSSNRKKNEKHVEKTCKGWRSMCPFFLLVYTISLCFHKFPPHRSIFELLKSMKSSNFLFLYQIEHWITDYIKQASKFYCYSANHENYQMDCYASFAKRTLRIRLFWRNCKKWQSNQPDFTNLPWNYFSCHKRDN